MKNSQYEKYTQKRQDRLIAIIASQLSNTPAILDKLIVNSTFSPDLAKQLAHRLANGEILLDVYEKDGKKIVKFYDAKTRETYGELPIEQIPQNLSSAIVTAKLTTRLQKFASVMDELEDKIMEASSQFNLDKYAVLQAPQELFNTALVLFNQSNQNKLFLDSYILATEAKNHFLNQLIKNKMYFSDDDAVCFIPGYNREIAKTSIHQENDDGQAIIENLLYAKYAFVLQLCNLIELSEYDALYAVITDFIQTVVQNFYTKDGLEMTPSLDKVKVPFKFLSTAVVKEATAFSEFLDVSKPLLDPYFIPKK